MPLPLGAKLALAGKMRCCCFAHWAGPKLDSCPVFSYSHARECELHFFSSKNPMCSVVLYYSHGNKKKIFQILFYKSGAEQTQLYNINIVKLPLKQTALYRSVGKCFKCSRKGQGRMGSTLSTVFFCFSYGLFLIRITSCS